MIFVEKTGEPRGTTHEGIKNQKPGEKRTLTDQALSALLMEKDAARGPSMSGVFSNTRSEQLSGLYTAGKAGTARKVPMHGVEEVELPNVCRIRAESTMESLQKAAQLTLHSSFDASDIFALKKKWKDAGVMGITTMDMLVFAVSRVLKNHRTLNAHYEDDRIFLFDDADIGLYVETPHGFMTPTLFGANTMTLQEISDTTRVLRDSCRQSAVSPDLLQGATFSILNLGALGVETFTPVLNLPQTGLLGVCAVVERLREGKPYPAVGLSLTIDHRALDSAEAARFLSELVLYLQNFSTLAVLGGA